MAKTSTAMEVGQEGSLREGLEAAIRERVREIIEMVLQEEVEAALGAPRSQRVAERAGLPAWIEATEADLPHGHRAAGRAAGAAGGGRWRRARVAESAGAALPEE